MQTVNYLSSKASCGAIGSVFDLSRGRFPAVVRVETTNACNARCKICPHSELKRTIRRMDDELFTRIIDECARYGCKEAHLHNFGEPLLDKQLEDRVRYAKQKGLDKVKIFSNGSLLDEDRARGLIEAGLDEIKISFDGADREEFEQIRAPLKFDEVVDNIKRLVRLRDRARSKMRIRVACCSTSDKQGTMQSLEGIVDGFSFGKIHNWGGESFTNGRGKVRKPCSRLWRTFTILADGDVALCCLDFDAQFTLGHLDADTTIRDVWTGAAYREVRARHKAGRQAEIHLCNRCTKSFLRP